MTEIDNIARYRELAAENRKRADALDQDSESVDEQFEALRHLSGQAEEGPKRAQIEATAEQLRDALEGDKAKASVLRAVADLFEGIANAGDQQAPSS